MLQHERERQAVKFQSEIAEIASGIVADARAYGIKTESAERLVAELGGDIPDDACAAVTARVAFLLQHTD